MAGRLAHYIQSLLVQVHSTNSSNSSSTYIRHTMNPNVFLMYNYHGNHYQHCCSRATVNHILLIVIYFSNLETHQNLASINLGRAKITLITNNM